MGWMILGLLYFSFFSCYGFMCFFPCSVTEMPFLHLFFFSRTIIIKVRTPEALWFRFLVVKNEECQNCFPRVITGSFNILYFQNTRQNRTCFCIFTKGISSHVLIAKISCEILLFTFFSAETEVAGVILGNH